MATSDFLRAVVPPVVRLGGRRLLPLTLGHALLLRAVGSPFAPYPGPESEVPGPGSGVQSRKTREPLRLSLGDVALARYILTRPWTEARDTMDSRQAQRALLWWGALRARGWMIEALLRHIAAEAAVPAYETLVSGEGRRGACLELILADSLIARGYHHDDAFNTPVALAWWLHLAHYDGEGVLRLGVVPGPGSEIQGPARVEYAPEVLQAWGEAQQQRTKAGRAYDSAVDSVAAFAESRVSGQKSQFRGHQPEANKSAFSVYANNTGSSSTLSSVSQFSESGGAV